LVSDDYVPLVLSLFPGLGLLDAAFEDAGFCVVRGPDVLWGGDVKEFHPPRGAFEGIIGGPPCKAFSAASGWNGTDQHEDLIPEFLRIIDEAQPVWSVMENVYNARHQPDIPKKWRLTKLRDWDCGGFTKRMRGFWTYPFRIDPPEKRGGEPEYTVIATNWINRVGIRGGGTNSLHQTLTVEEAQRLQGHEVPELFKHSKRLSIHLLGNGVPKAMGRYVANRTAEFSRNLRTPVG
jgi:DNA (cytosine-5)-methyltransferase 1